MKSRRLVLACLLAVLTAATTIAEPIPVPPGLVSWWKGEADGSDCFGQNHGSFVGSTAIVPGKVGNGFGFDSFGAVIIPGNPSLSFSNALTIELWFKTYKDVGYGIFDKRGTNEGSCNYGINVVPRGLAGYFNDLSVRSGDDAESGGSMEASRYLPLPSTGEFHHLAVTYEQIDPLTVQLQTYLNGAFVKSLNVQASLAKGVNKNRVVIGSTTGLPSGEEFLGVIDEVAIYNRVLTAAEVWAIYAADTAGKKQPPVVSVSMIPVVDVRGEPGGTYQIEYLSAVGTTNVWTPLTNFVLTTDFERIIDTSAIGQPHRYYRALQLQP